MRDLQDDAFATIDLSVHDRILHSDHSKTSLLQLLAFESTPKSLCIPLGSREGNMAQGDRLSTIGLNRHIA